ncbi:putative nuclease HARBI1 [Merluccius polli]|uniref:Nuclease HARBI1 n=1 Tax=Merluccius polli TaxID=89951 RepID=A0AA47NPE6_MERPO|nr:putative nuclease HARBI1 [Merluccius polli]
MAANNILGAALNASHCASWRPRLLPRGIRRKHPANDRTGFKELLRMTSKDFDFLLEQVCMRDITTAVVERPTPSCFYPSIPKCETFKSLGFQYRMGTTTVSQIVLSSCEALYEVMKEDYLKTPTSEAAWRAIAADFFEKWQYPNCLGALDGKHIYIQPPGHSGSTFHNYKGRFSVVLMAVVDAHYRFVYVSVGAQGRLSDGGLFAHSDLRRAMEAGLLNVPPPEPLPNTDTVMPYMLVADDAFPLRTDLQKPFPYRQLDHDQRIYNYRLSRARRVVENAFGILANRLRVFRTTISLDPDKVVKITLASCVIHNFLRAHRSEPYMPPTLTDRETQGRTGHWAYRANSRQEAQGTFHDLANNRARNPTQRAKDLRDMMKEYFNSPEGQVPWQEHHI